MLEETFWRMQLQEQFTVHHRKEGMEAEAWGSWSHSA